MKIGRFDWIEVLDSTAMLASSDIGKELIRETNPLGSPEKAIAQMARIDEVRLVLAEGFRPRLESLDLFSVWFERIRRKAVLKTLEFRDVRSFCLECIALAECLDPHKTSWVMQQKELLLDAKRPLSAIDQIMLPDGTVKTDASETLFSLHKEKQSKEKEIRSTLDRLVKTHSMEPVLQDRYVTNREGRWVLPVKSEMQGGIEGIIHDASQTKQTVFMEPQEIVKVNNRVRQVEIEIEKEIKRLLTDLTAYLTGIADDLETSFEVMKDFDVRFAQAQFSDKIDANACSFGSERFELKYVRHPLLALQSDGAEVIGNDIEYPNGKSILLLSGPNAGGKTVLLKAIGLSAQMARCGLPICSEAGSTLPFFENIHVVVGDFQSVDEHMSTFAAHLRELSDALKQTGPGTLLLVDEICGSTDPEEGAALAKSFIEHYSKNGLFGVITSHLGPLKEDWPTESRVICGSMEYDDRKNSPTFQMFLGVHGRSLAIKTAKAVGIPKSIIDRALSLISPEAKIREEKLDELETYKSEVLEIRRNLDRQLKDARENKRKYFDLVHRFREEREHWLKKAVEKGQKKIDKLIEEFRREDSKNRSAQEIKSAFPKIIRSATQKTASNLEEFVALFPPGTRMRIRSVGRDGVVSGTPNSKGEIPVLSESMRLHVHWKDLEVVKQDSKPNTGPRPYRRVVTPVLDYENQNIDLRGQRVEEALIKLERDLDVAMKNQADSIKIIHGHGTDSLKKAVRKFLSKSMYVKSWKAGDEHSGGDGLTWAELAD